MMCSAALNRGEENGDLDRPYREDLGEIISDNDGKKGLRTNDSKFLGLVNRRAVEEIKQDVRAAYEYVRGDFGKRAFETSIVFWEIPTAVERYRQRTVVESREEAGLYGTFFGAGIALAQIPILYQFDSQFSHPVVPYLIAATNLLSLLSVWGKSAKRRANKRKVKPMWKSLDKSKREK